MVPGQPASSARTRAVDAARRVGVGVGVGVLLCLQDGECRLGYAVAWTLDDGDGVLDGKAAAAAAVASDVAGGGRAVASSSCSELAGGRGPCTFSLALALVLALVSEAVLNSSSSVVAVRHSLDPEGSADLLPQLAQGEKLENEGECEGEDEDEDAHALSTASEDEAGALPLPASILRPPDAWSLQRRGSMCSGGRFRSCLCCSFLVVQYPSSQCQRQ